MRNVLETGRFVCGLAVLSLVALAPLVAAEWSTETVLSRTFEVAPGGHLRVDVPDADVELHKGPAGALKVEVQIGGRDLARSRELYQAMGFRAAADGALVRLDAKAPPADFDWRSLGGSFSIDVRVELPEEFNVTVRVSDGDLWIEALRGSLDLESADGDVHLGTVRAPEARIQSADGDIRIGKLVSPHIAIRTSDGDLRADVLEGGDTTLASRDGDIVVGSLSGAAEIAASDGDIRVEIVVLGPTTLETRDGDIVVGSLSGAAEIAASDGDIRVKIAELGPTTLETHDGNITIEAAATLRAQLTLIGESVAVRASAGFEGRRDESRAEGRLNGGGPALVASAADGDVTLTAR